MRAIFFIVFFIICHSTTQKTIYLDSIQFNTICNEPREDFYFKAQSFSETAETSTIQIRRDFPNIVLGTTYQINVGLLIWSRTVDTYTLETLSLTIYNNQDHQADPLISHFTIRWDEIPVSTTQSPERRRFNGVSNRGECQISSGVPEVSIWIYATDPVADGTIDSADESISNGNYGVVAFGAPEPSKADDSKDWELIIIVVLCAGIGVLCLLTFGYYFFYREPSTVHKNAPVKHIEISKRYHDAYRDGPSFQPSHFPQYVGEPNERHRYDRERPVQQKLPQQQTQQQYPVSVTHQAQAPTAMHHPAPQSVILSHAPTAAPTYIQQPHAHAIQAPSVIQHTAAPTLFQAPTLIQQPINQQHSEVNYPLFYHTNPQSVVQQQQYAQSVIQHDPYIQAPMQQQYAQTVLLQPSLIQQPTYAYQV